MSGKKFKSKKSRENPRGLPTTYPVDESDVIATWYVKHKWGKKQVALCAALINKFCFIANGRVLSRAMPDGFFIMGAFLDEASRNAAVANVRATGKNAVILECPVPKTRDKGFGSLASGIPEYVTPYLHAVIASDPLAIEAMENFMADRMERFNGDEGFIFPDLSPEHYEMVQQRRKKKPQ